MQGDKKFLNALAVEILLKLSHSEGIRSRFLHHLFRIILETAISAFDLDLWYRYLENRYLESTRYRNKALFGDEIRARASSDGLIRAFFDLAGAYSEDAAFRILSKISSQTSEVKKDVIYGILLPLMRELLLSADTASLEVQYCFQLIVKAYILKSVGKEPPKPVNWARGEEARRCLRESCDKCAEMNGFLKNPRAKKRTVDVGQDKDHFMWNFDHYKYLEAKGVEGQAGKVCFTKTLKWWEESHRKWEMDVKKVQQDLQGLPKDELEQALGTQYDTLMALDLVRADEGNAKQDGVSGPLDKTKPPALPKRPRDEDPDGTVCATPKRAQRGKGRTRRQ